MQVPTKSIPNPPDDDAPQSLALRQRNYSVQRSTPTRLTNVRMLPVEDAPVFSMGNLIGFAGYPWRAVRRSPKLAWPLFGSLLALTGLALFAAPKHYVVETKFFAEKNFVMPSLGNPKRSVPTESDSPTRLAAEAVMKRTNLLEIIQQTKLMDSWGLLQSPAGKTLSAVRRVVSGPPTDADRVEALVGMLEKRMTVTSNDGTVTIGIDWPDPTLAYEIVQAAQQNFFEQRHASEVALIGESIGILEGHVAGSERAIQAALAQINAALPRKSALDLPRPVVARSPVTSGRTIAAVSALQAELRTKQQAIADIAGSRAQRLSSLQQTMTDLRGKYGPAHPDIKAAEENIRVAALPSPQLENLRAEETSLRQQIAAIGPTTSPSQSSSASLEPTFARAAIERLARISADSQEAPEVTFAKSRLKIATNDYEDFLDRLEGAKIELETARAAFKYRYSVISPAEVPKKTAGLQLPFKIIGGLLLALLTTAFALVALEFGRARLVEPWQVDHQLGLPLLAEIKRR
jgi:uncharacterized protein involved in exopolysaccharide biosynthesis